MASRGAMHVDAQDGSGYYGHRQKVAVQYQLSAVNKSRLRYCIFFNFLLLFTMLLKLSADILDRLDIFILEIEELEIPTPLLWEYTWCLSSLFSFFGLNAIKKNSLSVMQRFIIGNVLFGVFPLLYGMVYYFTDVLSYVSNGISDQIQTWRELPCGLLWYAFINLALQVHAFSIYFAWTLIGTWRNKVKPSIM